MAGTSDTINDSRPSVFPGHTPTDPRLGALLVESMFDQLLGRWNLNRNLQSTNTAEPAGNCVGTATFTCRDPSIFINKDGKLETASTELVYHEQGYFEMQQTSIQTSTARFPFSRKYVWRLQRTDDAFPMISVWFTKPGTDTIDYLFHKVNVTTDDTSDKVTASSMCLQGEACHLCEEDLYSSSYTFEYSSEHDSTSQARPPLHLKTWTMLHEVRGPNKDQIIETTFTR